MAQGRSKAPLIVAVLVGVALIVTLRLVFAGGDDGGGGNASGGTTDTARSDCTEVVVAASSEKAGLLSELAGQWNDTGPQVDGRCVYATVVSKASGGAAQALAEPTWDEAVEGPRPDIWSPASSSWAGLTRQWRTEQDLPEILPADAGSVAQTPLVIAMPRPMAEALGWPDQQIGWSDLAALAKDPAGWGAKGHPEWGPFKLGKTNPNFSTSGLNATIGAYFAATGVSSDLTSAQVADPQTKAFVGALENSVVHYGDTTLTFLSNMQTAAQQGRGLTYVSAVTVEEKSVLDFNQGNPTGNPATLGEQPTPKTPLVAVYPKEGTLLSDNPWYILDAEWVDATKSAAGAQLLTYLQSDDAQARFQAAGFRDYQGEPGEVLTQANGFLPAGPGSVLAPPSPPVLQSVLASWDELRKRARVLMVLDVSGSMGEPVDSGQTKLELAAQATSQAVDGFADNDEVGLWAFSTDRGPGGEPWIDLVGIGPAGQTRSEIQRVVAGLRPDGGTALYATTRQAQRQMLAALDTSRINAIVLLSDGRNEYPPDDNLDSLLRQLQGESADTTVRVFTIGYGEGADPEVLQAIAEASAGAYYDATDPATIDQVLTSVISNF
ncbi:MAG: Ca-activated chloride channel [Actinomycetota bacterium]|nr:Ca-activated chloride channel [Actinomycetota bacterium]